MGDFGSYGQMLLPMLYHMADVIAFISVVVVGRTLHHLCDLLMADVIAKWQDGTAALFFVLSWQMLLPCGRMEKPHLY